MKDLAQQIRRMRKARGWTLEELSARSGLSVGFLSQLERGLNSPSISSLKAIADALGTSITNFFSIPTNVSTIIRAGDVKRFRIDGSGIVYSILSGPLDDKSIEPLLVELPPHYEGPPAFAHQGEEFGYVLEGALTMIIQEEEYQLNPGDSIHFIARVPHTWRNKGSKPVKAIWIVTPRLISTGGGDHEP